MSVAKSEKSGTPGDSQPLPRRLAWKNAIRADRSLSYRAKYLMLMLETYMDHDGTGAFPSQATLAEVMSMSRDTVKRAASEAVAAKYLTVKSVPTSNGHTRNSYALRFPPKGGADSTIGAHSTIPGCSQHHTRVLTAPYPGAESTNTITNYHDHLPRPLTTSTGELIEQLRTIYPERDGPDPWSHAEKQIRTRLDEGHTPEELIEATQRYRKFCDLQLRTGTQYVKQARTFYGPSKAFRDPWTVPKSATERIQDNNLEAVRRVLNGGPDGSDR